MSDVENDLDDELLALAGAGDRKRRKRSNGHFKSSTSKKRKADMTDSEDDGPGGEEGSADPYPLEGQYMDEADKLRLMQLSEVEREEVISARLEERQRLEDKRTISRMLKEQQSGDQDSVARAAKRQHIAPGATKEKTRQLDELRAKRKARDEKHRNSPRRERSSSPMDMDISDSESEDGQITKDEQEEERERRLLGTQKPSPAVDEPITMEDLEKCRLSRDALAKYCLAPWFQDYVQDAWVRYLIGNDTEPVYRICQVANLGAESVKPYNINDKVVSNQALDLKHGKAVRAFSMDKVSNGPFEAKEFDRLTKTCSGEDVKLPSKKDLENKAAQLMKLATQPVTESDISAMLARKSQLQSNKPTGLSTMERSRLVQARTLAQRRHDYGEVAEIDAKLQEFADTERPVLRDDHAEMLARVSERNRKSNLEVVRRAELAEAGRKRRERKHGAAGTPQPHDPSARLKTVPRLFNSATPTRPGTPGAHGSPQSQPTKDLMLHPVSPLHPTSLSANLNAKGSLEASVIESLEIDLGDF